MSAMLPWLGTKDAQLHQTIEWQVRIPRNQRSYAASVNTCLSDAAGDKDSNDIDVDGCAAREDAETSPQGRFVRPDWLELTISPVCAWMRTYMNTHTRLYRKLLPHSGFVP